MYGGCGKEGSEFWEVFLDCPRSESSYFLLMKMKRLVPITSTISTDEGNSKPR